MVNSYLHQKNWHKIGLGLLLYTSLIEGYIILNQCTTSIIFSLLSWPLAKCLSISLVAGKHRQKKSQQCVGMYYVGHWLISEGFSCSHQSPASFLASPSLSVSSPFCSPSLLSFFHWHLSFTEINGCPSVCVWVCVNVCRLQARVSSFYLCVFSCVHKLALSSVRIDRGSGPTGKEVGVGIDEAVNKVIGRINGDPKGTMSISVCLLVGLG